jgi:outer membrane lipoprotein-sorting protein
MIKRIFYSLSLFTSFTFADQANIEDLLNEALSHNYSFIERSLNQLDLKIEESAGEILFNGNKGFVVNISSPFKERYEVNQDKVTIFDLDLDQSRAINLEDINSIFIKVLLSGLSSQSNEYQIKLNDSNNFSIIPADDSPEIKFIFNKNFLTLIRYTDNLGIEHGIELKKL